MNNIYTPFIMNITGISNAQYAVVSFAADHPFSLGEIISFRVSAPYAMTEMNNLQSRIIDLTDTTITTEIDSSNFTAFVYPPVGTVIVPAQAVPSSSGIVPNSFPVMTNLMDAFDHILVT